MHIDSILHGATFQEWRLSDLRLLKTEFVDVGENHYSHIGPQEPRLGPDGAVYIETLACGLERVTGLEKDKPRAQLVYTFPGAWCGVPTIVGHYLIEGSLAVHGMVVLDISNGAKPVEVGRLKLGDNYNPHWTAWDPITQRLVVTSGKKTEDRLYLLKFDQNRGVLTLDETFRDVDGKVGFGFVDKQWPHGWKGSALPHGAVFTR